MATGDALACDIVLHTGHAHESNPDLLDARNEPWPGGTQHELYTVGIEVAPGWSRSKSLGSCQQLSIDRCGTWTRGIRCCTYVVELFDTKDRVVEGVYDASFPGDRTKLVFTTPLAPW